jgi:mannose-6-phosphate isomerase-like protein (cupin superfamily)
MDTTPVFTCLADGSIFLEDAELSAENIPWSPHPAFSGVSLKHLVSGRATDGRLSCHLVRVEPGKVLETHVHDQQWELHEVMGGSGNAMLDERSVPYAPGTMAVIPRGVKHRVQAGKDGLLLCAKFFPALV